MQLIDNFTTELKEERRKIDEQRSKACLEFDQQIFEIDGALAALEGAPKTQAKPTLSLPAFQKSSRGTVSPTKCVIEAVSRGARDLHAVERYIVTKMGIHLDKRAISNAVYRMNKMGRITRDRHGYKPVSKKGG